MEISADEEMVVSGLKSGVSDELELEGVLGSLVDEGVVAQTSQLEVFEALFWAVEIERILRAICKDRSEQSGF